MISLIRFPDITNSDVEYLIIMERQIDIYSGFIGHFGVPYIFKSN